MDVSLCLWLHDEACMPSWLVPPSPQCDSSIRPARKVGFSEKQRDEAVSLCSTVLFCFGDSPNHEEKLACQMKLKGSQSKLMPRCTNSVLTTEACCTSSPLGSATMLSCQAGKKAARASASEGRKEGRKSAHQLYPLPSPSNSQ